MMTGYYSTSSAASNIYTFDYGDKSTTSIKYVKWPTISYEGWDDDSSTTFNWKAYKGYTDTIEKTIYKKCWYNTTTADNDGWIRWDSIPAPAPLPLSVRLREILQARQGPAIIGTRQPMAMPKDPREERARETLRIVLGEGQFRNFIRNGFVTVKAKSGKTYQIFPAHGITAVYEHGKMVERLCVVLRGDFPPTDSLIMRYLLILNDEADFRSKAIVHSVTQRKQLQQPDQRPLTEIYRELVAKGA